LPLASVDGDSQTALRVLCERFALRLRSDEAGQREAVVGVDDVLSGRVDRALPECEMLFQRRDQMPLADDAAPRDGKSRMVRQQLAQGRVDRPTIRVADPVALVDRAIRRIVEA
jgi:hypothetical protein